MKLNFFATCCGTIPNKLPASSPFPAPPTGPTNKLATEDEQASSQLGMFFSIQI